MSVTKLKTLSRSSASSQRGISSIVFIVLVSLALTTTSVGLMHSFSGDKNITVASNAVTHSQNGMWLGAEVFRRYIADLSPEEVQHLQGVDHTIGFNAQNIGEITARNINLTNGPDNSVQVMLDIENVHQPSMTSSALKVVYSYQPGAEVESEDSDDGTFNFNFEGDLTLGGGISVQNGGEPAIINVDGNVFFGGDDLNPVERINATGNITLENQVRIETLYSNGDVLLDGGASVGTVFALGTFYNDGDTATNVFANGDVEIHSEGRSEYVTTRGNITYGVGSHGVATAGGWIDTTYSGPHDALNAIGDIDISGGWQRVESAISMADIYCTSRWWSATSHLSANGTMTLCPDPGAGRVIEEGASNVVPLMDELQPIEHVDQKLDVWDHVDEANYFVEYDATKAKIKVTVENINGVTNGSVYYLGNYSNLDGKYYMDYLCGEITVGTNDCSAPTEPLFPLCLGPSTASGCISYDDSLKRFHVNPAVTAPGVIFVDGNLLLENGHGISTMLASGNISTSGGYNLTAPNAGSYDKVCLADSGHIEEGEDVVARYEEEFAYFYPSQFCVGGSYVSSILGNIGLSAGGYPPATSSMYADGDYVGGSIFLGASADITGAVLAGDVVSTEGDVIINGEVSSAREGSSIEGNDFSGVTQIDLDSDNPDYDPKFRQNNATPTTTTEGSAQILWVRNL